MGALTDPGNDLALRLEQPELVYYPVCPFPLPAEAERAFLYEQRHAGGAHKNVSYNPTTGAVSGFRRCGSEQAERLRRVLADFGESATRWLASAVPQYGRGWQRDRVSLLPEEEATRKLRLTARNDLLHIDAFPSRPSGGRRILRLFVNIHPFEPRVWQTSDPFQLLLERYGERAGLPGQVTAGPALRLVRRVLAQFDRSRRERTDYDEFMLRLHDYLKLSDEFQDKAHRRVWRLAPGSAWLVFTDGLSYASLRGQHALEHSYFVPPECLSLPDESPATLLRRACAARLPQTA